MSASKAFSRAGLTSVATMLISLLTGILAARVLGPELRGYLAIIVFWPQLLAVLFRIPFSNVIVVLNGRGLSIEALGRTAFRIALFATCLAVPIVIGINTALLNSHSHQIVVLSAIFATIFVFCSQQTQVFEGVLRATKWFDLVNALRLSVPLGYLVFGFLFALLGFGLTGFVAAHSASMILSFGFRFVIFRKKPKASEPNKISKDVKAFPVLRASTTYYWIAVSNFMTVNVDRFFVMLLLPPGMIGQYFVAMSVAQPLNNIVVTMLQSVGLPQLIDLSHERQVHAFGKLMRLTVLVSTLSASTMAIVSPFLIPVIYGSDFTPAGILSAKLSLVMALTPVRNAATQLLMAVGRAPSVSVSNGVYLISFASAFMVSYYAGSEDSVIFAFIVANVISAGWSYAAIRAYRPEFVYIRNVRPQSGDLKILVQIVFSAFRPSR